MCSKFVNHFRLNFQHNQGYLYHYFENLHFHRIKYAYELFTRVEIPQIHSTQSTSIWNLDVGKLKLLKVILKYVVAVTG